MTKSAEIRKEIAEKMSKIIGGSVWAKGEAIRIYLAKGYVVIEKEDSSANIDSVGGHLFMDIKKALTGAGFTTYR